MTRRYVGSKFNAGNYIEALRQSSNRLEEYMNGKCTENDIADAVSLHDIDGKLIKNFASIASCARYVKCYPKKVQDAIKSKCILMDKYYVSYVKKERPDISKVKRI